MKSITEQIHLRNMLNCLTEIEHYCSDTNPRQLEDENLRDLLKINFTILGLEAVNSGINHHVIDILKSFLFMDFSRDMDNYALYSFIVNDISVIKKDIMEMKALKRSAGRIPISRPTLALAG